MKKIVLFGDSLFNGFTNHQNTAIVTDLFKAALPNTNIDNISKSGATTVEGLDYIHQIDPGADLVVIEYGTNDSSTGWGLSLENYQYNLLSMINQIGRTRVIVVGPSLPDPNNVDINQFYPADHLNAFNQVAKTCAELNNAPFADLIASFKKQKDISPLYQADGQHLTPRGNAFLVNSIVPSIKKKLNLK